MTGREHGDVTRDDDVARVLRRVPRDTATPPYSMVEARLGRRAPLPLALAAGAAAVLLAAVVGNALGEWRDGTPLASPSPTPETSPAATATPVAEASPTATALASPTATATPTPGPVLSDRFGFVWLRDFNGPGVEVMTETGQRRFELPTGSYSFSECSCAVSPDGRRIAYWTSYAQPGETELRIVDVARPTQTTTLYRAPADERVSGAVWSSDGTGILFSTEGINPPGSPPGGPPDSALLVIEARGGDPRVLVETNSGAPIYIPLGWDRAAGIAAAGETGEGGTMFGYLTVRTDGDPAPRETRLTEGPFMLSVAASSDQRFVMGSFPGTQGLEARWWKLGDISSMSSVPNVDFALWRPGTPQIAWIDGNTLRLLDVESGATAVGGTFPEPVDRLTAFRQDGSAVVGVWRADRSAPVAGGSYFLLELGSDRTEDLGPIGMGALVEGVRFE